MQWSYLLGAISIGVMFAFQPVINATLARVIGSPFSAAAVSVSITLVSLAVLMPIFGAGNLRPANLLALPWWVVLGGFIGVAVVAGGLAITPVTGAAVFFVCVVTGQLIGAAFADHVGAFGLEQKPISALRIAGIALVIVGAVLVRKG